MPHLTGLVGDPDSACHASALSVAALSRWSCQPNAYPLIDGLSAQDVLHEMCSDVHASGCDRTAFDEQAAY